MPYPIVAATLRGFAGFPLLLALAACSPLLAKRIEKPFVEWASGATRETMMRSAWKGRSYDSLVAAYGEPTLLEIPGNRPEEMVAVYRLDGEVCIDAFTVHNGPKRAVSRDSTVTNYFCR